MKKFIFTLVLGVCISCSAYAQSIQIPTIHIAEFNLDSIKTELSESHLYFTRLEEIKLQLKQEMQEINVGFDIVKSCYKNQKEQFSLTKEKIKLFKEQIKTHKKSIKDLNSEIKSIDKQYNQLNKSKQISHDAKVSQSRSLENRKVYLNQQIISLQGKMDILNRDMSYTTDEFHRLEQLKLDIQSADIELKRLKEACKFKQDQIKTEMKIVKKSLK